MWNTDLLVRQFNYPFPINISHSLFSPQKNALQYDLDNLNGLRVVGKEWYSDEAEIEGQFEQCKVWMHPRSEKGKFRPRLEIKEFPNIK